VTLTNVSFLTNSDGYVFARVHYTHGGTERYIDFSHSVGHALAADMLRDALNTQRWEAVEAVRKAEYNAGWKDAKSKKRRKREWFSGSLKREAIA
jgi:hypothetical protein